MGIPNLLFVKSHKHSDTNVEKLFIDMVSAFIRKNGLCESTLVQIPAIMVRTYTINSTLYIAILLSCDTITC